MSLGFEASISQSVSNVMSEARPLPVSTSSRPVLDSAAVLSLGVAAWFMWVLFYPDWCVLDFHIVFHPSACSFHGVGPAFLQAA